MKGLKWALLIMLGLSIIDYFHLSGISMRFDTFSSIGQNLKSAFSSIFLPVLLFQEFLFPFFIAIYTLFTGTYGFFLVEPDLGNAIFNAANLLTLNSSDFSFIEAEGKLINLWLINARLTGGFFLAYAFFLALSLATGKENINRLKFWFTRKFRKEPFYVVIGDTQKALFLALDFEEKNKKIVFLYQENKEDVAFNLEGKDIYYMTGNVTSRSGLEKTYFELAEKVYLLNDSDDENFRACQEMIEIMLEKKSDQGNWFVLMKDLRKRTLLTKLMGTLPTVKMKIIDINQNVARKLVLINDTEALADPEIKTYQNIIFGFNELARAIVMQLLRVGHFPKDKRLHIQVFYEDKDQESINVFKAKHPELFIDHGDSKKWRSLKEYTFLSSGPILDFTPLPSADSQLINPNFKLYDLIRKTAAINIYVCLANGLDSASLLATLLPRLNNEENKFLKAYCYYNYLDEHEELMIKERLSEITNNAIPVSCFGNDLANCQINAIENHERDLLAKYIAYLYDEIYNNKPKISDDSQNITGIEKDLRIFESLKSKIKNWKIESINKCWDNTKEIDKESNRQAADHAIIKFALRGKNPQPIEAVDQYLIRDHEIDQLAEVEHRRWNAEKLLLGWLPAPEEINHENWLENKNKLRSQKFHFHLSNYDDLPIEEKGKDHTQIMGLPYIFKAINLK